MGASKQEFCNLRMATEDYIDLPNEYKSRMLLRTVDEDGIDYSHDDLWKDLKKKSDKAYKDLKNREFDLRHNIKL